MSGHQIHEMLPGHASRWRSISTPRGHQHADDDAPGAAWPRLLLSAGVGAASALAVSGLLAQFRTPDKSVRGPVRCGYSVRDEQFLRTQSGLLPPPILPDNRVTTLLNGDEIFPQMLEAIRSVQRTVTMETFIYWSGKVGRAFAEALAGRARTGVQCHVLLDWYGSRAIDQSSLNLMRRAGVQITRYHRRWWHLTSLNHRTHRKLLVIDGRLGFTGGVGIADQWLGHAQDPHHWRDNHYRVEGPVVAQLQSAFTDNWLKSQHMVLHDADYFPALEPAGNLLCQTFQSSPDEGSESMRLMYLLAIAAARQSIRIASAYFVPDKLTIDMLLQARQRGVEIDIVVPGPHIDRHVVRHASRDRWRRLLQDGIRIFEYMPTMYHVKAMVVDELWTSIGSANFDNRSFRINSEANLNVYDADFAARQVEWFEQDKGRCRPVALPQWRRRPARQQLMDNAAATLSPQL